MATKQDIASKIADAHGLSKNKAEAIVGDVLDQIMKMACAGEEVALHGFGKIKCNLRPGGERRNPRTGEPLTVAEKRVPKFTPAKAFKDRANA